MNDDQYFLANAYVDGELTDDERRIAEADPDVMSEVEVLRALAAELRSVEAPSASARESAIAAAMAEFGASRSAPVTAAAAARVVPHRPRPAWMSRSLGIAAAVVAVGLLGVVVVSSGLGGGDDDADADPAAAELGTADALEATAESAYDTAEADVTPDELATAADDDGASDMADEMSEEAAAEMSAEMSDDMSEEMSEDMGNASTAGAEGGVAADETVARERPDIDPDEPIETSDELGALGTTLLELEQRGTLPATPNTSCPPEFNILGTGVLLEGAGATDIYVAVQVDDDVAIAIAQDDCSVLLEGRLFPTGN